MQYSIRPVNLEVASVDFLVGMDYKSFGSEVVRMYFLAVIGAAHFVDLHAAGADIVMHVIIKGECPVRDEIFHPEP
jgi:hypothetical protein